MKPLSLSDNKLFYRVGGVAFMIGNLLFALNKLDDMSRLFLSRPIPDLISGQNPVIIIFGQIAMLIGYYALLRFYSLRFSSSGRLALRIMAFGGTLLAFGHLSFMTSLESLFLLVILGVAILLIGLIWFGILNLKEKGMRGWKWLPLTTGLMGVIGFFFMRTEEITVSFLIFRTLFALGLIGLGLNLWLEKSDTPSVEEPSSSVAG